MNRFFAHILALLLLLSCSAVSAKQFAKFDHFSVQDGLASNRVYGIAQDERGFVWVATDFGLSRFDGRAFRNYSKKDYPSLIRDDVYFVKSFNNKIFTGGYNGLLLEYDYESDSFVNKKPDEFEYSSYKEVKGICKSENGVYYAYTIGGLYKYDPVKDVFTHEFPAFESFAPNYVSAAYVDRYDRFWLGSVNSMFVVDSAGNKIANFNQTFAPCEYATTILPISDDKVAVSFLSSDLWVFELDEKGVSNPEIVKLPFGNVRCVFKDSQDRYWFATDGFGLWFTDDVPSASANFQELRPFNSEPIDFNKIYAISEDKNGNMWFGTQNSGLWRLCRNQTEKLVFSSDYGFPSIVCNSFAEDDNGNLIVASDGGGMYSVAPDFKEFKKIKTNNTNVLCAEKINSGEVLLTTWGGGLLSLDSKTDDVSVASFDGINTSINCFFSLKQMPDGEIWVGTANDGIYIRDNKGKWRKQVLKTEGVQEDRWVYSVYGNAKGVRWAITSNTIWRLDDKGLTMLLPDVSTLKTHLPRALYDAECDDEGNLYVVCNKGVLCFPADGSEHYMLDFIPGVFFRSILRSKDGRFWIAGDGDIGYFNPKEKKYVSFVGDFNKNIVKSFYQRASFEDSDGNLYFGTMSGFFKLSPTLSSEKSADIHYEFSDLYMLGKKVKPLTSVLKNGRLSNLSEIELKHNQTDISVTVDIVSMSSESCQFRYILEGLGEQWQLLPNSREIAFSFIPHGSYDLIVEPCDAVDGKALGEPIKLHIEVLPPWWAVWWFQLLLVVLISVVVLLFFKRRERNLVRIQNILREKVDKRTSELKVALEDKDRLISVIGHDLKNPMFAIVGSLDLLKNKEDQMSKEEKSQLIDEVRFEAKTLQDEMVRLVEWAKSKREELVCNISDTNLSLVAKNVFMLLEGVAEQKKIELKQNIDLKHYALVDSRMLGTILRNLMGNAVKFTPAGGSISLNAFERDNRIVVSVIDSGVGMDDAQLAKLLDAEDNTSTKGTNNEEGTGLGFRICQDYVKRNKGSILVKSEKGKGTTVTLEFLKSDSVIKEAEVVKDVEFDVDRELTEGNSILIVDDDYLICRNLSAILDPYVNVIVAHNGAEALKLAEENLPDMILSDVDMPEMNGIELGKALNSSDKLNHIPVIYLSAKGDEQDRLRGLVNGAVDYISKPFSQTELLIKVCNQLKIRQKQQSLILSTHLKRNVKKQEKIEEPAALNPFTKDFIAVLDKRYSDSRVSVEDLASDMNMSQSTLNRRARSIVGKSPLEMLNEYRLNMAAQMLKDDKAGKSISDIAYDVGFSDPAYFTKKFKDYFGCTPSQV
ncbi:MAG: two-component regulator propeller domain-containing protein [Paludibacteraceae bacterium]|nr:two-component regulator propeller domain-containing protein [Paludibacteraceae bacterium]